MTDSRSSGEKARDTSTQGAGVADSASRDGKRRAFHDRRRGLRRSASATVRAYSRIGDAYVTAMKEHVGETLDYVDAVLRQEDDSSFRDLFQDALGLGVNFYRRWLTFGGEIFRSCVDAGKPDAGPTDEIKFELDEHAEASARPVETSIPASELGTVETEALRDESNPTSYIPKDKVSLTVSPRSNGFVLVSLSGLGTELRSGTYVGHLSSKTTGKQLARIVVVRQ